VSKKISLFCTKPLGEAVLKSLIIKDANIGAVVTKKGGTGWWGKTNIEEISQKKDIPLYYDYKEVPFDEREVGISVLYHEIFDKPTIDSYEFLLNLHMGELPRYRGTNCTAHTTINARKDNHWFGGASLHFIDSGIDSGPIVDVSRIPIDNSTTNYQLFKSVEVTAFDLYKKWENVILTQHSKLPKVEQKELISITSPSYYYYRNSLENKILDIEKSMDILDFWDLVRGLQFPPFDPAQILSSEKLLYLIVPFKSENTTGKKKASNMEDVVRILKNCDFQKEENIYIDIEHCGIVRASMNLPLNWKNHLYKTNLEI